MSARWVVLGVASVVVLWFALDARREEPQDTRQLDAARHTADSLKALLAQAIVASEKADTVYRVVRKSVPVVVNVHDTLEVIRYVALTDSALKRCDELADSCKAVREEAKAQLQASERVHSLLADANVRLQKKLQRQKLTSRFGLYAGYGVMRGSAGELRSGVTVGLGVRVWP
jgi:hypothetical protein